MPGEAMRAMDIAASVWDALIASVILDRGRDVCDSVVKLSHAKESVIQEVLEHSQDFCQLPRAIADEYARAPWVSGVGHLDLERVAGIFALRLGIRRLPATSELAGLADDVFEKAVVDFLHCLLVARAVYFGPLQTREASIGVELAVKLSRVAGNQPRTLVTSDWVFASWKERRINLLEKDRKVLGESIVNNLCSLD